MLDKIKDTIDDLALNLVVYDRKEDEDLPLGAIEDAIKDNQITVNLMAAFFRESLRRHLDLLEVVE